MFDTLDAVNNGYQVDPKSLEVRQKVKVEQLKSLLH